MQLAFFDMDLTLTDVDTVIDFIKQNVPIFKRIQGLLLSIPLMVIYRFRIIDDTKVKNILFRVIFNGWTEEYFRGRAKQYNIERLPSVMKPAALEKLEWHRAQGHRVVVASGTIDLLVADWCSARNIELLANTMEFKNSMVTGKMVTKNCYGMEKRRRILEHYNLDEYEMIYAYGDSTGDKDMLALADKQYYRIF